MSHNPGSDDARGLGCKCSPRLNANGKGAGKNGRGETLWVVEKKCPLHGDDKYRPKSERVS